MLLKVFSFSLFLASVLFVSWRKIRNAGSKTWIHIRTLMVHFHMCKFPIPHECTPTPLEMQASEWALLLLSLEDVSMVSRMTTTVVYCATHHFKWTLEQRWMHRFWIMFINMASSLPFWVSWPNVYSLISGRIPDSTDSSLWCSTIRGPEHHGHPVLRLGLSPYSLNLLITFYFKNIILKL